ncbi:PIN domain-containing protein [Candidatus Saccharibacteria bacterium]|nr:PIN domain-containing protein [Candidatus Saccharibacteria bacterium]
MELNYRIASLDSCIILRLIRNDNTEQRNLARDLLLNGQDFYVDDTAIMEVVHVLTREHVPREKIHQDVQLILNNPMIIYDRKFFDPIFEKYASHPSLSFDDCVLEARAETKGALPLWTFDQKFARQSDVARLLTY